MMPEPLKEYLEICDKPERGKILQVILKISTEAGFDNAIETVSQALTHSAMDPDSLLMVHKRINMPELRLRPAKVPDCVPDLARVTPDIAAYDRFLEKAGEMTC